MYRHYSVNGEVKDTSDQEAHEKMTELCDQWEDEVTPLGKLFMGVFDWAYSNEGGQMIIEIPNLRTGGTVPKNEKATEEFGFDIYGDCFLKLK